ncbi:unnamed protein product, partial [Prorocentrum cordatum]
EAGDRPPKKPAARAFPPRREGTSSGRAARSSEACPEAREEAPRATRHKQLRRRRPRGAAAGETSPSDERLRWSDEKTRVSEARGRGDLTPRLTQATGAARCSGDEGARAPAHAGSLCANARAIDPEFCRRSLEFDPSGRARLAQSPVVGWTASGPAGSPEPHAGSAPERAGARPRRCEGPGRQQTSG